MAGQPRKVMSEKGKNRDRTARTQRRADALRENLHRRKLQARSRNAASAKETVKAAPGPSREQSGPDTDKR
jgi:hypothetical protein